MSERNKDSSVVANLSVAQALIQVINSKVLEVVLIIAASSMANLLFGVFKI